MVNEKDVLAILPESGFIGSFVRYCQFVSDAPLAYSLFTALAISSTGIDPIATLPFGGKGLGAHFWSLIVGASGSRKTHIGEIGTEMLQEVSPNRIGSSHESEASLLEALNEEPQQMIFHGEFGDTLAGTHGNSYKHTIRMVYTKTWDGIKISKNSLRIQVEIARPRLSLLCCVAPSPLENYTDDLDWSGGFLSRYVTVYAVRERDMASTPEWPEGKQWCIDQLAALLYRPMGQLTGMTPEAEALLESWAKTYNTVEHQRAARMRWTEGTYSRMIPTALKAAIIISCDIGAGSRSNGNPWRLGVADVQFGIEIAELHLRSIQTILDSLAIGTYGKQRRNVLNALGDDALTKGEIMRMCHPRLSKKVITDVLESLKEEKMVFEIPMGGVTVGGEAVFTRQLAAPTLFDDKGNVVDVPGAVEVPLIAAPDPIEEARAAQREAERPAVLVGLGLTGQEPGEA